MELQLVSSTFGSNVWFFSMCSTSILMRLISRTTRGKSSSRMTSFGGYQKCSTSRNIRFNFRTICLDSVHFCVIWRLVNLNCCMYVSPEVLTDIRIRTASKVVDFYKQDGEIFGYTWSSPPPPPLSSYSHPRTLYFFKTSAASSLTSSSRASIFAAAAALPTARAARCERPSRAARVCDRG